MNEFEWITEQCEYTDLDVKRIKQVCRYFGHKTIQDYVNKLMEIRGRHEGRLYSNPHYPQKKVKYYADRIERLDKNIVRIQLMADTHNENLFGR